MCGGCKCHEGFSGRRCECGGGDSGEGSDKCERDEESGEVCGGRGLCKCGRCQCDKQYLGENCECERDSVRKS